MGLELAPALVSCHWGPFWCSMVSTLNHTVLGSWKCHSTCPSLLKAFCGFPGDVQVPHYAMPLH